MSVELRHHAKRRGDLSNCCRDIAIFVMSVFRPPTKGTWWSLSLCKIWWELEL